MSYSDDLFDSFYTPFFDSFAPQKWAAKSSIRMDILEKDDCFEIAADIPSGASKEDVHLEFDKGYLTLSVSVKDTFGDKCKCDCDDENCADHGKDCCRFIQKERYSGTYSRRVFIDANLDRSKFKASYLNGVLFVIMPKIGNLNGSEKFIAIE